MTGSRLRVLCSCLAVAVVLIGSSAARHGAGTSSEEYVNADINGVCGTLLGAGTSVASLGKTVAARGAGWFSAILAAHCLAKDVTEYADKFNASPEGQAQIAELKRKYGHYTYDDWMRAFGCTKTTLPRLNPDDVSERARSRWDCSTSPYGMTD